MPKSKERLAMEIFNKTKENAEKHLERFGFSPAERAEITAVFARGHNADFSPITWQSVAEQIKSTLECSVRIGDRIDTNI